MVIEAQTFMVLIAFALLVEAVIENVKWVIEDIQAIVKRDDSQDKNWNGSRIVALILAIVFSVAFSVDVWDLFGFEAVIPFIGAIGTGIIIARGANFAHDLINKLGN